MDTIVALMTPPGRSAVALLRLSGEKALAITKEIFTGTPRDRRAVLGYIVNEQGERLDHVLSRKGSGCGKVGYEDLV